MGRLSERESGVANFAGIIRPAPARGQAPADDPVIRERAARAGAVMFTGCSAFAEHDTTSK